MLFESSCLWSPEERHDRARSLWHDLARHFREERQIIRAREPEVEREGGTSYYVVRRHSLGNVLLDFVRRSLGEGATTHTKAGQVLGVKPRNVDPLLQVEGSR